MSNHFNLDQADRYARYAERAADGDSVVAAMLAIAWVIRSVDARLEELVELERDRLTIATKEAERPCNYMGGGGSAGIDTADDFAKHCGYVDGHDGPHSYEEEE